MKETTRAEKKKKRKKRREKTAEAAEQGRAWRQFSRLSHAPEEQSPPAGAIVFHIRSTRQHCRESITRPLPLLKRAVIWQSKRLVKGGKEKSWADRRLQLDTRQYLVAWLLSPQENEHDNENRKSQSKRNPRNTSPGIQTGRASEGAHVRYSIH